MSILNIQTSQAGLVGTLPTPIYIDTNDTYAEVTATGYLNEAKQLGQSFSSTDMALVQTSDDGPVWLKVEIVGADYSLAEATVPGNVTLPTIANNLIVSTDADGTLANLAGVALNSGSIQAGANGLAGSLISVSSTDSSGDLRITAVANSGNHTTSIINQAMGQGSTITIPDPGASTANFVLTADASGDQIIESNLAVLGNVTLGADADAGTLTCYPATTLSGTLQLDAADNVTGDFFTRVSNSGTVAQDQIISIPDSGAATGDFLLSTAAATQSMDAVSFSTTAGIVGTTTNDDADAGSVGEFVETIILSGTPALLSTTVAIDVGSMSLEAGDWDVYGNVSFLGAGAITVVLQQAWTSTTSSTLPSDQSGYNSNNYAGGSVLTADDSGLSVPFTRLSLSGTTTVYLSARAIFSGGTYGTCGVISARRVR